MNLPLEARPRARILWWWLFCSAYACFKKPNTSKMILESNVVISCPVEEVYAHWSRMEQYPEWFDSSVERRKISEGPLGVGTRYHGVEKMPGRRLEFTLEITAFEPHTLMAATLSPPVNASWTATFESIPDGTRMTLRSVAEFTGIMRWLAPLLKGWASKTQQIGLDKFKSSVEALRGQAESGPLMS